MHPDLMHCLFILLGFCIAIKYFSDNFFFTSIYYTFLLSGFVSWRNTSSGSYFMQALTEVFDKHSNEMELNHLLVQVCCYYVFKITVYRHTNTHRHI